ncbi:MFS transporter [Nocardia callitridis]|uniref:MFS transporter n=1 Tax=Nocardia callitridis TaxID=648753 RepID=A0ABP9K854_9NOCA
MAVARGTEPTRDHRPGRRLAPTPFAILTYTFTVVMLATTLPTPMYALYAQRLHFSVLTTTVIFATYAAGVIAALIGVGRWSDVLGRKPLLLAGIVISAASSLTFLTAGPVWQLLIGRALSGISAGIFAGAATAAVIEAAAPAHRAKAAIVATVANMGGLGLGPLIGGVFVQYLRWPLHLVFAVHVVLLLVAAIGVLVVPETAPKVEGGRLRPQALAVPAQVRSAFVPAAIVSFAGFAVLGLFTAVVPAFLEQILEVRSHAVAGLVVSLIFIGSVGAQLGTRGLRTSRALTLGGASLLVGILLILTALLTSSASFLVLGALVAGAGQGMSFSKAITSVSEAAPPDRRAEITSTLFVVAYLAISVPVVGEGMATRLWGLRTAGVVFAIVVGTVAAVATLASWWVGTRRSSDRPE